MLAINFWEFCLIVLLPSNAAVEHILTIWNPNIDLHIYKGDSTNKICILFYQVGTVRFPAHQYIVASCCEILAKRIMEQTGSSGIPEIEVKDMRPDVFRQILQFIYTNDCSVLLSGECPITWVTLMTPIILVVAQGIFWNVVKSIPLVIYIKVFTVCGL